MIAVINYGLGNIRSVQKAFESIGYEAAVTADKQKIRDASHIVVPGVGAMSDAMKNIEPLAQTLIDEVKKGKPFLGICLGMQMLFEESMEGGVSCLGLLRGRVVPFDIDMWVPHVGWNNISVKRSMILDSDEYLYFVHSYHAAMADNNVISATTDYGRRFVSAIEKDNLFGVQFHPEKSGEAGLKILKKFGGIR